MFLGWGYFRERAAVTPCCDRSYYLPKGTTAVIKSNKLS